MTPLKSVTRLSVPGPAPAQDGDVLMDAEGSNFSESSMISSPPKANRYGEQNEACLTASRLFGGDDDENEAEGFERAPRRALRPLDLNLDLSEEAQPPTDILRRKTKLEQPQIQRKRNAEYYLDGRDLSFDDLDSPVDMYASPRISPSCYKSPASQKKLPHKSPSSFRTLDGRTVQSKNPFSPMLSEDNAATTTAPLSESLNFPVSFEDDSKKKGDESTAAHAGPLLRHRLHKRDPILSESTFSTVSYHYNSFTRDGYPERKGMYSFTGSPIKETDHSNPSGSGLHKVRRINEGDDVVAAASHLEPPPTESKRKLQVETTGSFSDPDEVSPTDVLSFPSFEAPSSPSAAVPPTPAKPKHRPHPRTRYTPVRKQAVPNTPMPERRSRPVSYSDDKDDFRDSARAQSSQQCASSSRFLSDFDVIGELGNGSFGDVFKVLSRFDGCMYAVKVAHRPARGNADRDRMLKEVYALAALSDQADTATFHIVRYHQAWMEENRLYIQTELCTTTLAVEMKQSPLAIERRYKFLREMCLALEFLHKHGMVHLDIKPENIFIKNDQFKLGDFGLVSKISYHDDVEEGDSRYMSKELLSGDHADLTKSDIFSLGMTLYEVCLGGKPLPTNGPEWQALRSANIPDAPGTPNEMNRIIKVMMNPAYIGRPSASELLKRPQLLSEEQKALLEEKNKVVQANLALAVQTNRLKMLTPIPRKGVLVRANTWNGG